MFKILSLLAEGLPVDQSIIGTFTTIFIKGKANPKGEIIQILNVSTEPWAGDGLVEY